MHMHSESMTLMFQREVAEQITARPGDKAYSRLSVLTRWLADSEILFDVPASAFVPAPKITSSVVQIVPLSAPRFPCSQKALERGDTNCLWPTSENAAQFVENIGGEGLLNAAKIDPKSSLRRSILRSSVGWHSFMKRKKTVQLGSLINNQTHD